MDGANRLALSGQGIFFLKMVGQIIPKEILTLRYYEMSYWGGVAGVVLAVWLAANSMGPS